MKSKTTAAVLAILVGGLGAHKFYLNSPIIGILYLVFCWTFIPAIVAFFEGLMYLFMSEDDFNKKYNPGIYNKNYNPRANDSYQNHSKVCNNCNSNNDLNSVFCSNCGKRL